MWDPSAPDSQFIKAHVRLSRRDPILRAIIRSHGPCTLVPKKDPFTVLVNSIISQQISTKAAESIANRVKSAVGGKFIPRAFDTVTDEELRASGLSTGKVRYMRDLVAKVNDGTIPLRQLSTMPDDEVKTRLIAVKGIGPWTADMFLMFALGRPDILPVGDLGIQLAFQRLYSLQALPKAAEMEAIAEPWRPFRTVGCWYLWRSHDDK